MGEILLAKRLSHLLTAAGLHVLHGCHASVDSSFLGRWLEGPGELLWRLPSIAHGVTCQSHVGLLHDLQGCQILQQQLRDIYGACC